jgi:2-isopropylmalate synthase
MVLVLKTEFSCSASAAAKLELMDCTLAERIFGVSFAVGEKLAVARELDSLGIAFVESPLPEENPKESEYLKQLPGVLTRNHCQPVIYLNEGNSGAPSDWIKNVTFSGNCSSTMLSDRKGSQALEKNLDSAIKSATRIKKLGKNVFFKAEHFFDGFEVDTAYALSVLEKAVEGGSSRVILCDTRGSSFPDQIEKATRFVVSHFSSRQDVIVGIDSRNDCGLALANTLSGIRAGARHIDGSINGVGERCGKTDLCELLPLLVLMLGYECLNSRLSKEEQLLGLRSLSEKVSSMCGFSKPQQPFVSGRAFAHVDPDHVIAVERNPESYEVLNPSFVGNYRKTGVDDASLVLSEMWKLGLYAKDRHVVASKVLARMRELEAFGYKFEDAKASVHLLILETIGSDIRPFQIVRWETSNSRTAEGAPEVKATIELKIGEGEEKICETAKGVGPIHAIDVALRKALDGVFPELRTLKLVSYSLNIVDSLSGTAAAARARTEFVDEESPENQSWATISVSDDVLDASVRALIDGYRYKLIFRNRRERYAIPDWKVALSERYSERC